MNKIYLTFSIALLSLFSKAQSPTFLWNNILGNSFSSSQAADAIDIDPNGNVIYVGRFSQSLNFNPDTSKKDTLNAHPQFGYDLFIAKYKKDGSLIWAKNIGGNASNFNLAADMKVDKLGNIFITGGFSGAVDFDPSKVGVKTLKSNGTGFPNPRDVFVSKYDNNGNLVWAYNFGGKNDDYSSSLDLDKNGNVYFSGTFHDTVDFSIGGNLDTLIPRKVAVHNVFMCKYSSSGNFGWVKQLPAKNANVAKIAYDQKGSLYLTGQFFDTLNVNTNHGQKLLVSPSNKGVSEIYLAKFDTLGNNIWGINHGGINENDFVSGLSTDTMGNIFTCGAFYKLASFYGKDTFNVAAPQGAGQNIYFAKYASDGKALWAKSIENSKKSTLDNARCIATDATGNIYLIGGFSTSADFDPSVKGVVNLTGLSQNSTDLFFAKYTSKGDYLWAYNVETHNGNAPVIKIDNENNFYFCGVAYGAPSYAEDFDIGVGVADAPSTYSQYIYLTKYFQCNINANIISRNDTLTAATSSATYQWYDCDKKRIIDGATSQTYTPTISGNYKVAIIANGCVDTSACTFVDVCKSINSTVTINVDSAIMSTKTYTNATYKWVNCDLGFLSITAPGADSPKCYPTKNNINYAVIVSRNGCVDTSDCVLMSTVGIKTIKSEMGLSIYPNPVLSVINLEFVAIKNETIEIEIMDLLGQHVFNLPKQTVQGNFVNSIDVSGIKKGVYFLTIKSNSQNISKKFLKQ